MIYWINGSEIGILVRHERCLYWILVAVGGVTFIHFISVLQYFVTILTNYGDSFATMANILRSFKLFL